MNMAVYGLVTLQRDNAWSESERQDNENQNDELSGSMRNLSFQETTVVRSLVISAINLNAAITLSNVKCVCKENYG